MHRSLRPTAAVVTALVAVAGLAACAASAAPTTHVVIVGAVEGSPFVGPRELDPIIGELDAVGDRLVVIVPDGEPHVAVDVTIGELPENALDAEDELATVRRDALTATVAARADDPEADYAEAVALAARILGESAGGDLTVFGSGIVTTGAMSMLGGRFDEAPQTFVDEIEAAGATADLSGVRVSLPTAGLAVSPQPPLTAGADAQLRAIWTAVLEAAKADEVRFGGGALQVRGIDGELPTVTPLPVERIVAECANSLDESRVQFVGDEATFIDPAAATTAIAAAAQRLGACSGPFTVEASTSSFGTPEESIELAERRALAAAAVLSSAVGIPIAEIRTVAWGLAWPCRVHDRDADGAFVESYGALNRLVVISRGVEPGTC